MSPLSALHKKSMHANNNNIADIMKSVKFDLGGKPTHTCGIPVAIRGPTHQNLHKGFS